MFALTQDNLSIDIDNSTFNLILSFLESKEQKNCINDLDKNELSCQFNYLQDLTSKNNNYSINQDGGSQSNEEINSVDANDDQVVFKKIYSKCKKIYDEISLDNLNKENKASHEMQFNCSLLTLDCLLNMNQNMKKNLVQNIFYKNELREKFVMDKILVRSQLILESLIGLQSHFQFEFVPNEHEESIKKIFLINKLKSCINFIETLTQSINHSKLNNSANSKKLKSIKYIEDEKEPEANEVNQNYLIDLKNRFTLDFIKQYFFSQIILLKI